MDSYKDEFNKKKLKLNKEQIKQLNQARRKAIKNSISKLLQEVNRLSLNDLALMEMQKRRQLIMDPLENSKILTLNTKINKDLSSDRYLDSLKLDKKEYETPIIGGDDLPELLAPILSELKEKDTSLINKETLFKLEILSGLSSKLYNCAAIAISDVISEAILTMSLNKPLDDFTNENHKTLGKKIEDITLTRNEDFKKRDDELNELIGKKNYSLNKPYDGYRDLHNLQSVEKLANQITTDLNKNNNKQKFIDNIIDQCQVLDDQSLIKLTFYLMKLDIAAFKPTKDDNLYLCSSLSSWNKLYNICAIRFDYYYYQDHIPSEMNLLNQLVVELYKDPKKYALNDDQRRDMARKDLSFAGLTNSISEVTDSQNTRTQENKTNLLSTLQKMQKFKIIESINEKFSPQDEYVKHRSEILDNIINKIKETPVYRQHRLERICERAEKLKDLFIEMKEGGVYSNFYKFIKKYPKEKVKLDNYSKLVSQLWKEKTEEDKKEYLFAIESLFTRKGEDKKEKSKTVDKNGNVKQKPLIQYFENHPDVLKFYEDNLSTLESINSKYEKYLVKWKNKVEISKTATNLELELNKLELKLNECKNEKNKDGVNNVIDVLHGREKILSEKGEEYLKSEASNFLFSYFCKNGILPNYIPDTVKYYLNKEKLRLYSNMVKNVEREQKTSVNLEDPSNIVGSKPNHEVPKAYLNLLHVTGDLLYDKKEIKLDSIDLKNISPKFKNDYYSCFPKEIQDSIDVEPIDFYKVKYVIDGITLKNGEMKDKYVKKILDNLVKEFKKIYEETDSTTLTKVDVAIISAHKKLALRDTDDAKYFRSYLENLMSGDFLNCTGRYGLTFSKSLSNINQTEIKILSILENYLNTEQKRMQDKKEINPSYYRGFIEKSIKFIVQSSEITSDLAQRKKLAVFHHQIINLLSHPKNSGLAQMKALSGIIFSAYQKFYRPSSSSIFNYSNKRYDKFATFMETFLENEIQPFLSDINVTKLIKTAKDKPEIFSREIKTKFPFPPLNPGEVDIVMHESTRKEMKKYLQRIQNAGDVNQAWEKKLIGNRLAYVLSKSDIKKISVEEFIDALLKTKRPGIKSEHDVQANGSDWTKQEVSLLGRMGEAVHDVTIQNTITFTNSGDNNQFEPPTPQGAKKTHFLFLKGALLEKPIDTDRVSSRMLSLFNRKPSFDKKKFKNFLIVNLLPYLVYASNNSGLEGAVVALPIAGGNFYAGGFKIEVNKYFPVILEDIIKENATALSGIKAFVLTGATEDKCTPISDRISFIRTKEACGLNPGPVLKKHNTTDRIDMRKVQLFNCLAADHCSDPGCDLFRNSKAGQEAGTVSATNFMETYTGVSGERIDGQKTLLTPTQGKTWQEAMIKNKVHPQMRKLYVVQENGKINESILTKMDKYQPKLLNREEPYAVLQDEAVRDALQEKTALSQSTSCAASLNR